jgi:two-component system sensor histidine kinase/response regulator
MMKKRFPIALVEDNEMSQRLIEFQLKRIGFDQVKVLDNAVDAIAWLAENDCALLLTDCQMPRMSGYELTRLIREREKVTGAHLAIIAITASAMEDDKALCIEAGMDGYLPKPIQMLAIRTALAPWLSEELQ